MMEEFGDFKCRHCNHIIKDIDIDIRYCPFCGKSQYDAVEEQVVLDDEIEKTVYEWLAKTLSIDSWLVSETVKNQMATVFLLVWPILETKIFNNDMSHNQMNEVANYTKDKIDDTIINPIFAHFYNRYQDKNKLDKLKQGHGWSKVDRILDKPISRAYKDEKIVFLIYVVYRYRNNIFHGIKSLKEWNRFSTEIQYCIRFMVELGNVYEN